MATKKQIQNSVLDPDHFEHSNHKEDVKVGQFVKDRIKQNVQRKAKEVTETPHPLDRHSGNGIGKADKKLGAGKANWGTMVCDLREPDEDDQFEGATKEFAYIPNEAPEPKTNSKQNSPNGVTAKAPPEFTDENFPKLN